MSAATIATLPRNGGNGRALFTIVSEVFNTLFASRNAQATSAKPVQEMSLWELYRLTAGYDSINPRVAAHLRAKLVGK